MSPADQMKILKELENTKKLLILHLVKSGASGREIRAVLRISGREFNKLFPLRKVKKYNKT
jgi:hypothetical protein